MDALQNSSNELLSNLHDCKTNKSKYDCLQEYFASRGKENFDCVDFPKGITFGGKTLEEFC